MWLWDAIRRRTPAPAARVEETSTETGQTVVALPSLGRVPEKDLFLPGMGKQFKIRLAGKRRLRSEASALIKERYAWRGYRTHDPLEGAYRLSIVAYDGEQATGTLTVGLDSPAGLRSDDLYKAELDCLRAKDRRLCEFIKLAVNPTATSVNTLAALFHVAYLYAHRIRGYDDVVIEVNPRHVAFYRRALGFEQLGPERQNPRVEAPAILLWRDFSYITEQLHRFGGKVELRAKERSLFPYGFSPKEEQGILRRLQTLDPAPQ